MTKTKTHRAKAKQAKEGHNLVAKMNKKKSIMKERMVMDIINYTDE
jgi:hypothetical protein